MILRLFNDSKAGQYDLLGFSTIWNSACHHTTVHTNLWLIYRLSFKLSM